MHFSSPPPSTHPFRYSRFSLLTGLFLVVITSASPLAGQAASKQTPAAEAGASTKAIIEAAPAASAIAPTFEIRKPFAAFSASAERLREEIVSKAREAVGTRYKLGGTKLGVGFDCSGLVQFAMSALEMVLPRTAQSQSQVGLEVPKDIAALEPGDVLTFGTGKRISHVGIYIGEGKMIHASTTKRRVIETSLSRRSPLIKQWKGVRRFVEGITADTTASVLALADSLK